MTAVVRGRFPAHMSGVRPWRTSDSTTRDFTTLRVRLVARREDRIALMRQERGLLPEEAARYVDTTEQERIRFVKDYFHKDPTEPQNYDVMLNASRFTVAECAEVIVEALHRLQARQEHSEATALVR